MKVSILFVILLGLCVQPVFGQAEKIRRLKQSLPSIQDSTQYVDVLNTLSMLFYEQNADSTLYYALRAREIAFRLDYAQGLADAANNMGVVFDIKGNVQLALRYYNDAYNQYTTLKDSSNIVQTLMNIGSLYSVNGQDKKAQDNLDKALSLGNIISHDSIVALVVYNYLLTYPSKFSEKQKSDYINRIAKISEKYHDLRLQLAIQQLRADRLIANNERQKGIQLLEQTVAGALEMQLYYLSVDLLIDLGNNHLEHDHEKAMSFFNQALTISQQKGYRIYAQQIYKKLYETYLNRGDNTTAFFYSKKLLNFHEQQAELNKASGIDYLEYAIKDQQLVSQKVTADYNEHLFWLAAAVSFLSLLSLIFLWRNWSLARKTNQVLTMQFRQLESTTEDLEKSNHNFAKLIKIVAHDLRNPIGAIQSLSSVIIEEELNPNEKTEFVQLIYESSGSCLALISDLLQTDFTVHESGLTKETIDLSAFLQQTLTLLTFKANEKKQQLILQESELITITADRDKLMRVLNNLIINAIKFSPDEETIYVQMNRENHGTTISVKDHGLGIPKDQAEKLFDPFTPFTRTGTAGEQPFGLGLYISKQIVEAHQGRIWFESEEGKGTRFFIFLPDVSNL
jgi:signal transduction histidine kinase